ncbi:MAG: helix-turn-helix domain-containing protein [Sphaerobacteraceae bacterium]|nr:MAG: helix-turn-helix domain-containing protein [Sphaerobacteraceae bacterium]
MPFRGKGNTGERSGWNDYHLTGFGLFLRQAREYKGVSLRDVEKKTRIPRRHLHALETEQFDQLPPLIYARGIVRNYAQFLGVDPMDALARFEQSHGQRSGGFQVVPAVKTTEVPSHWAPNFAIIAFMVIMSAVIFAWMYSAYFAPPDPNGDQTEQAAQTPEQDQEVAVLEDDDSDELELAEGGGETLLPLQRINRGSGDQPDSEEPEQSDDAPADGAGESPADAEASQEQPPDQPDAAPSGNVFTISTTEAVWVQATVDGQIVLDDVVPPGRTESLQGETLSLRSGNAPYVQVSVNGEFRGTLGDAWDAVGSYP